MRPPCARLLLAVPLLVGMVAACSNGESNDLGFQTRRDVAARFAANRVVFFLVDVQQARNPEIFHGGVEDPLGSAYSQLCPRLQQRISEAAFRKSKGAALSAALTSDGGHARQNGVLPGGGVSERIGVDALHEYDDTLRPEVRKTWINWDLTWTERGLDGVGPVIAEARTETWRVDLTKTGERWQICGLTKVS